MFARVLDRLQDKVGLVGRCFEGKGPAAAPSAATAVARLAAGCSDTDQNAIDAIVGFPDPHNALTSVQVCDGARPHFERSRRARRL